MNKMSLFDFLPKTEKCCVYSNLRTGSILIALFIVFTLGMATWTLITPPAEIKRIITVIMSILTGLYVISALVFLLGICMDKKITAEIFLFSLGFQLISLLIIIFTGVVWGFLGENLSISGISMNVFACLLTGYFMIVVRSYKEEMMQ
ncbi:uncharacterized protein LOC126966893 [Leptidea sinapis]|uniref:uncharacterized protein LOC126966893 n=1 Tax=Leptidea sinapis TaxID=189913 RepID=UPI0021C3AB9C|nr:uncharacterized protein LOC126966893 [Leptidea sinapis]